jgi:S-adenosylmethionine:tRNA-ribosyltransferase-isomerase (queuine synthetase)
MIFLHDCNNKESISLTVIYNRLRRIDSSTWKQVIDVGEQTGKLSFNDICVIKTVMLKMKQKENIDLKRLEIVNNSLDKINKFGLHV